MILLIQRVTEASVTIDGAVVGKISRGLLAFVAVEPGDDEATGRRLVDRAIAYRVFPDEQDRMNCSLVDVGGELLLVSQFTLAADTRKGLRPSFTSAAAPEVGRQLFEQVVEHARLALPGRVATGRFGAEMRVALVNDGPVTFWMRFSAAGANESS